jgi:hypothetical protein
VATTGGFVSNNCLSFQGAIEMPGPGIGGVVDGSTPRKLIFCPSTGSHYAQASAPGAGIDFIYEDSNGNKQMSPDGYVRIDWPERLPWVELENYEQADGIYIPSQDRMLYIMSGMLFYILPCNPDLDHLAYPCDTADVTNAQLTKNIPSSAPESLIYCPSNDRIYVFCEDGTLFKVRPDDLEIEETYTAPLAGSGSTWTSGVTGKTFTPIYSHANDTIYYMSNDVGVDSFLFEPNY